jgi:flavin reductase (DIM6/NTAB) family NADH-FMN oxidoreductase RutF
MTHALEPHRLFATTVALVTSQVEGGPPNVMACEWTMNVCWRPLKIMCVVHSSDLSHELIAASGEFGVNLCADNQAGLSHVAGSSTGRSMDKLSDLAFARAMYRASRIRAPMIRGCILNAECVVEQTVELGEYTGFVGHAVAVRMNPHLSPLVYHRGRYFEVGSAIAKPGAA